MLNNQVKNYPVAVIGATGSVGREILNYLEEREFPISELIVAASNDSAGKEVSFGKTTLKLIALAEIDFSKLALVFFCTEADISAQYVPIAAKAGCIVIDKSTYFRLDQDVALIVPEVNAFILKAYRGKIIANPNCCTIPLAAVLKPLDNAAKIKRVVISTYQSVSGAGKKAMDELYKQTKAKFIFENIKSRELPAQIAFNLFPHIGDFRKDGYTEEEHKIACELTKIIGNHIKATLTCVRVPVFVSHAMAVNIEFEGDMNAKEAEELLYEAEGVTVYSNDNEKRYITPVEAVEYDDIYVSRIRDDFSCPKTINLWIVTDNLRKGAALNSVQIAEEVVRIGMLK